MVAFGCWVNQNSNRTRQMMNEERSKMLSQSNEVRTQATERLFLAVVNQQDILDVLENGKRSDGYSARISMPWTDCHRQSSPLPYRSCRDGQEPESAVAPQSTHPATKFSQRYYFLGSSCSPFQTVFVMEPTQNRLGHHMMIDDQLLKISGHARPTSRPRFPSPQ